ncbi:DUF1877 family protein [Micromonospora auratinigra]|uniref:DUF1877 domain-containing protein n=1 Tax=Micromonospora auratinigra TaxID=261654 RepID=A0A1A9A4T2_9ACTN|nr:DUF1877 family protein [Micromonospora auratinigra]SBT51108.1 protein of unknown function (DUF1877) [Micromonospora auratinigra]
MAVTQQLARLSADRLAACRASADELARLCGYELLPSTAYLDLDWSPAPLLRAAELGAVPTDALRRALTGDVAIGPAPWVDEPVTALEPAAVADVAQALGALDPTVVLAAVPADAAAAAALLGLPDFAGHPRPYLHRHVSALSDFYRYAAGHRLAVALWWD